MAGRYDHNPFAEEEEVNPFAVSSLFPSLCVYMYISTSLRVFTRFLKFRTEICVYVYLLFLYALIGLSLFKSAYNVKLTLNLEFF